MRKIKMIIEKWNINEELTEGRLLIEGEIINYYVKKENNNLFLSFPQNQYANFHYLAKKTNIQNLWTDEIFEKETLYANLEGYFSFLGISDEYNIKNFGFTFGG